MIRFISGVWLCLVLLVFTSSALAQDIRQITDAFGRIVDIPEKVEHIICSGSGCLRLASYLGAQDLVVGVDDVEKRNNQFDARPYAFANPQYKDLPVFGGFRGRDVPEKIISLPTLPQVIFKTYGSAGYDPAKLSQKTGIPVITLEYGDLFQNRQDFYNALTLMGQVLDRQKRAEELISFFNSQIKELERRTRHIPEVRKKSCFVGGIAFKGPHGFKSTEPGYPPFEFIHAKNIARPGPHDKKIRQSNFSKEKILIMDPEVLFLDLSTLQMGEDQGGLYELKNDPVYQNLSAVKNAAVFGALPYNSYTQNFGSILADAWFMGKILYPNQFTDIDPEAKADEIYKFLLSKPLFEQMDAAFKHMTFKQITLK